MNSLLKKNTARTLLVFFILIAGAWLGYVALHHKQKLSLDILDLIPAGERSPELILVKSLADEKQSRVALFALHVPGDADRRERASNAFIAALLESKAFSEAELSGDNASRNALGKAVFDRRLQLLLPGYLARQRAAYEQTSARPEPRDTQTVLQITNAVPAFSKWLAEHAAADLENFMVKPEALAFGETVGADPLLLLPPLAEKLRSFATPDSTTRSDAESATLVWALTSAPPLSEAGQKPVFNAVDAALAAARAIAPDATLRWTAVAQFAAANRHQIIVEAVAGTAISIVIVLFIAAICLPSLSKALRLLPVVFGALLGASTAVTLCFERVHVLVFVLGLMLVGVSIDYGFYLYLQPKKNPGDTYADKVRRLMKPLLGSALTTVLGFSLLLFSNLPLIRQLGVFVSAGLLCALAISVLWFAQIKNPFIQARSFASAQLHAGPRPRRAAIGALGLGVIVAFAGCWFLHWRDHMDQLQVSTPQLRRDAVELRALFGDTTERTLYITHGDTIGQVRDAVEKFGAWHETHFPKTATASLAMTLPLRADWDALPENIAALRDFEPQLRAALDQHGFDVNEFESFFTQWRALSTQAAQAAKSGSLLYNETVANLAASLRGQAALLMSATPGASWIATIATHPAGEEPPPELSTISVNQLESLNKLFTRYRISALRLSLIGLALVGLSMWLIYGVKRGTLIFTTPVGSCLFAFGVLGLCGVTLNLFHLLGAFLGVCLSHNYAIFTAENEARHEQPPPSIRLSALSTAASFGVLACSSIPVVSSLGITVTLIVLTALAVVELKRVASSHNIS